jgi:hypothetical protein
MVVGVPSPPRQRPLMHTSSTYRSTMLNSSNNHQLLPTEVHTHRNRRSTLLLQHMVTHHSKDNTHLLLSLQRLRSTHR